MKIQPQINRLGYASIPDELQEILFPGKEEEISRLDVEKIKNSLKMFGLSLPQGLEPKPLEVPDFGHILQGLSPKKFLDQIVLEKYQTLKNQVTEFLSLSLPAKPTLKTIRENLNPGWTRYPFSDDQPKPTENPLERVMVCDVETYVKMRGYPVMAAAVTSEAWYIWLHPSLLNDQPFDYRLIPLGKNKVIVNHSVSFDAARFDESYNLTKNELYFLDTMSMHIAVAGMGNQQRLLFKSKIKNFGAKWRRQTSGNGLIDTYNLHCKPLVPLTEDDKAIRNIFVVGHLEHFRDNLLDLIRYNLDDLVYTHALGKRLWPKYLWANPELFTIAGHCQLASSVLPVVSNWDQWVHDVNKKYDETQKEVNQKLTDLAHKLIKEYQNGTMDLNLWYSQLDWAEAKTGKNKGVPLWYRKGVLNQYKKKGKYPIGVKSNLAPLLLKMSWKGSPLFKTKSKGWCYLADEENPLSFVDSSGLRVAKIPHPKGDSENCGSPLGKDYLKFFKNGVLSSEDPDALEVMKKAKSLSYWSSMHSRVEEFYTEKAKDTGSEMIKPGVIPHGTVTRRAVEPTWLTCSDIKPEIIGSELKSRVQAPEGYVLVGADFDGQESRIGAGLADTRLKIHGSSAMSLTQMIGDKDLKTDGHSLLAKDLGLWPDRQLAKTLNFLMLFFGGVRGLFEAIKTARTDLRDSEAKALATKALKLRRGAKDRGTGLYKGGTDSEAYNFMIRNSETPENRTILGRSAISKPLQKTYCGSEFMPSRCNRNIQSTGVDILHVFLSLLEYFVEHYQIEGKFIISIHDEIWSIVKKEQKYKMAWIFQLCHMLSWSIFYEAYEFQSIPFNYLFFSSVNIDAVLRKEVNSATVEKDGKWVYNGLETPSNPYMEALKGESIKASQLMELI